MTKIVFISYRRVDSGPTVDRLSETIAQNFGRGSVFVDTSAIQAGDIWPQEIQQALRQALVVMAVIGPEWIRIADRYGFPLVHKTDDWVHKEIKFALRKQIPIIPLLVQNADLPERAALPGPLSKLTEYQAFELRRQNWEPDIDQLLGKLEDLGLSRTAPHVKYPERSRKKGPQLTDVELRKVLKGLSGWELDDSRVAPNRMKKIELRRTYEFKSFEDAIHFMNTAARHVSISDHHPDWENVWKTITVWLTTWDLDHRPSRYDVDLAQYLDNLYQDYDTETLENPNRLISPQPARSHAIVRRKRFAS